MAKRPNADLIVTGCGQLVTRAKADHAPRVGEELSDLAIIENGAFAVAEGRLVSVGTREQVLADRGTSAHTRHIDAGGAVVMPGFVDCHTHTVFAEYRLDEYEWRVAGTPYADIAARGGVCGRHTANASTGASVASAENDTAPTSASASLPVTSRL